MSMPIAAVNLANLQQVFVDARFEVMEAVVPVAGVLDDIGMELLELIQDARRGDTENYWNTAEALNKGRPYFSSTLEFRDWILDVLEGTGLHIQSIHIYRLLNCYRAFTKDEFFRVGFGKASDISSPSLRTDHPEHFHHLKEVGHTLTQAEVRRYILELRAGEPNPLA